DPNDAEADRGVKRARFVVLKENPLPATLVEGGFLTNPLESRLVNLPEYRQRLAECIADGIGDFLRKLNAPLAASFKAPFVEPNAPAAPTVATMPASAPSSTPAPAPSSAPSDPPDGPAISTTPPSADASPAPMAQP
ncbi:MAG TPA: N-acetylmuramoyl-L-alanine amidase, partial [Candidatus Methylacidiphilales bacterium]